MLSGRIKNLHHTNNKMFATIEYDDGNKLIFYDARSNNEYINDEFSIGEKVYFEEKITRFGTEATNLFKMIDEI